jgi:hypothetical protein
LPAPERSRPAACSEVKVQVSRGRKERHACSVIGMRQYREMESSCASAPAARKPENIKAAGRKRERETNDPDPLEAPEATKGQETNATCRRETAKSMEAWETNMPERETATTRRDSEPLTSAAQERRQEKAAAEQHQAAAGEQPLPPAREGTEPVTSPVTNPKTRTSNAVDTDGRQLIVAKVSRAETSHIDPRPLNEPTAKPCLEAVCIPARYSKTGTEHLSTFAGRRIIQVARGGVEGSPDIDVERHSCSKMNVKADLHCYPFYISTRS